MKMFLKFDLWSLFYEWFFFLRILFLQKKFELWKRESCLNFVYVLLCVKTEGACFGDSICDFKQWWCENIYKYEVRSQVFFVWRERLHVWCCVVEVRMISDLILICSWGRERSYAIYCEECYIYYWYNAE